VVNPEKSTYDCLFFDILFETTISFSGKQGKIEKEQVAIQMTEKRPNVS